MSHIDGMMDTQKGDWERDLKDLETKLLQKEHEILLQRSTLEQKHTEIGRLKQQIKDLEDSQRTGISEYDTHLDALKEEVRKVKHDYEKLNKRHHKQTKECRHDKEQADIILQDHTMELQHTKDKVEEYVQKSKDWELQRRTFQKQIETLEHQRKALTEKCEFVQGQSQTYQSQVERRRQLLDNSEVSFKSQIAQLESQLERTNQTLVTQEGKVEKLKCSLEDAMNAHKKAMDDNERLLVDLKKANNTVRKLEEEKNQMEADLQSKDDFLYAASEDNSGYREDLLRMEAALAEKDNIIRSLGDIRSQEEGDQVRLLKEAMHTAKEETRKYRRSEKQLKEEVTKLQSHLKKAVEDCERLADDLENKKAALERLESDEYAKFRSQISQLQEQLQAQQESHQAEVEGMNKEVGNLASELHGKDVAMATLSQKASGMEKQMRQDMEVTQKKTAELQVANAQIEAIRLENRHLRQTILQQAHTNADKTVSEEHMRAIQNSYSTSVSRLEHENQQLREDMECLKEEMNELEERYEEQVRLALQNVDTSAQDDRIKRFEENSERRVEEIQERLHSTTQQYKEEVRILKIGKAQLEAQLELEKRLRNTNTERPSTSRFSDFERSSCDQDNERKNRYSDTSERHSRYSSVDSPARFSDRSRYSDMNKSPQFMDTDRHSQHLPRNDNSPSEFREPDRHSRNDNRLSSLSDPGKRHLDTDHERQQLSPLRTRPPIEGTTGLDLTNDLDPELRVNGHANASFETVLSSRPMSISDSLQDVSMEVPSPRNSVSQKFLEAENKRAKELEFLIDSHIEDLKHGTDKIVKKYNRRR
ncbi:centrosomal protein of 63 kDa-like isoform X2 [Mizuhopecten yessoensis]|uniref:Centrosomal protein of 63 kDa n=2 Tax=Mizuhopecten yessoensis TaxID=6573 RepID=A0A210QLS2_MIZYE|nr:centrosomal protein of 63 kDa-like isoform X2 [Mizuhopecten yessoensis]XP_021355065.1 centrosomal protein of 63 kDa-like isoform X2 [Mizuhopecten yessoensis]OWF49680.1 Centrosomal protein of 63 kDa [Mizuhopecten yessoensis]